jgi:non-ribosomal peptide synthetase component F
MREFNALGSSSDAVMATATERAASGSFASESIGGASSAGQSGDWRRLQLIVGDDPAEPGSPDERLDRLFEQLARRYGTTPAVISEGRTWSYAQIDARANRLARLLIERGVKPGDRVGLLLNRSADTYVAMLAVMKARAAYVPLAVAFPEQRIAFIIEDASLVLVVSISPYREKVLGLSVPHLLIDEAEAQLEGMSAEPLHTGEAAPTANSD